MSSTLFDLRKSVRTLVFSSVHWMREGISEYLAFVKENTSRSEVCYEQSKGNIGPDMIEFVRCRNNCIIRERRLGLNNIPFSLRLKLNPR